MSSASTYDPTSYYAFPDLFQTPSTSSYLYRFLASLPRGSPTLFISLDQARLAGRPPSHFFSSPPPSPCLFLSTTFFSLCTLPSFSPSLLFSLFLCFTPLPRIVRTHGSVFHVGKKNRSIRTCKPQSLPPTLLFSCIYSNYLEHAFKGVQPFCVGFFLFRQRFHFVVDALFFFSFYLPWGI